MIAILFTVFSCAFAIGQGTAAVPKPKLAATLTLEEFRRELARGEAILVDVRTPREYASGHIPGSINLDWTARNYEELFAGLDPAKPLLLYCAVGGRSDQAREYLQARGYMVHDLEDGIGAWKDAGSPLER